jgi:trimethylamine--corrinoid protein Co-methyltransferase
MQHFREVWYSQMFDRNSYNHWLEKGAKDLSGRVRERTIALMDHQPAPLDGVTLNTLEDMSRHWE